MQNLDELPGCEAANYHEEMLNAPSLIWQMLNSRRFWLYAAATCTVSAAVMHFGFFVASAATASVFMSVINDVSSKLSSNPSLLTIAAVSIAALFSPIGSFFYQKPDVNGSYDNHDNSYEF